MLESGPISLRDLPGQKRLGQRLLHLAAQRPGGRVFLFWGPSGASKKAAALALASACLCRRGEQGEPCLSCPSCVKLAAGSHPDLIVLRPEENKKKIGIDQAREVIKRLTYPPLEGDRRAFIIPDAELLSLEAANALLKTLEEPPPDTLTVLTTSQREGLPATILSRCQSFLFPQPEEGWLLETVSRTMSVDRDTARLLSALAQGDPQAACDLDRDTVLKRREIILDSICRKNGEARVDRLFELAREVADKDGAAEMFLDLGAICLRDLLLASETRGDGETFNRDLGAELAGLAGQRAPGDWAGRLETVLAARAALDAYANRRLTLEAMMLKLGSEDWEDC